MDSMLSFLRECLGISLGYNMSSKGIQQRYEVHSVRVRQGIAGIVTK